jgi:tetratricopeptide (TPR) repeat protein
MTANEHLNSSKSIANRVAQVVAILLTAVTMTWAASAVDRSGEQVVKIVSQIQRADYEGDRSALKRLHAELATFAENKDLAARVGYWRGFALWRRAINGFNDHVDPTELQADLRQALAEFDETAKENPTFADAKIGALSCVSLLGYAFRQSQNDPAQLQEFMARARQLWKELQAAAPDNPRLLWVMGPNLWYVPEERGGGQAKAMEMYEQGLQAIRKHKTTASDPLEPSWGEPELLMNLAWSNLNRTTPDLNAAEQYARRALELVPYWHYVRDILLPQIQEAQRKTEPKEPSLATHETQRHAYRKVDAGARP